MTDDGYELDNDDLQFERVEKETAQAKGLPSPGLQVPAPDLRVSQPGRKAMLCAICGNEIGSSYYALHDKPICATCKDAIQSKPPGSPIMRGVKATALGLGAGLAGAVVWCLVRRVANMELGIIAIAVGYLVGKAVFWGSGMRGGRGYQVLAVALTYGCIAANYMPDIFEQLLNQARAQKAAEVADANANIANANIAKANIAKANIANANIAEAEPPLGEQGAAEDKQADGEQPADPQAPGADVPNQGKPQVDKPRDGAAQAGAVGPAGKPTFGEFVASLALMLVAMFVMALTIPFWDLPGNVIGLLIIGFALWEAWKFAGRQPLPVTGPYELAPQVG